MYGRHQRHRCRQHRGLFNGLYKCSEFSGHCERPHAEATQKAVRPSSSSSIQPARRFSTSVFLSRSVGQSIAVDALGSAYVSGTAYFPTPSGIPAFPLTSGVFSGTVPSNVIGSAAFAAKLSPDGSTILYSTLLQQPFPILSPFLRWLVRERLQWTLREHFISAAWRRCSWETSALLFQLDAPSGDSGSLPDHSGRCVCAEAKSGCTPVWPMQPTSTAPVFQIPRFRTGIAVDSSGDAFVDGLMTSR